MWNGPWPNQELQNYAKALDAVELLVSIPQRDQSDEVGRALARFLVVRACGYLEVVAEGACTAYVRSKSAPSKHSRRMILYGRA